MRIFQQKILVVLCQISLFILDFLNLFWSDILMYEVTEGISFDLEAMVKNGLFWGLLVIQFLHLIITICIYNKNKNNDQAIADAIAEKQIELLSQVTSQTEKGNFEEANKLIDIYDKLAERRKE